MQFIAETFPKAVKIAVRYHDFQMYLNTLESDAEIKDEILLALMGCLIDNDDAQMLLEVYGVDDPGYPMGYCIHG